MDHHLRDFRNKQIVLEGNGEDEAAGWNFSKKETANTTDFVVDE